MGKPKLLHKKATGGAGRTSATFNLMKTQMKKEARFYEHDRHVLRFHGMWDDRASPCGMLNPLEVHYYLADDTLEITEKLKDPLRRGYEAFPTFLKKCKCAKNWEGVKMGQAPDYVTPDDLVAVVICMSLAGQFDYCRAIFLLASTTSNNMIWTSQLLRQSPWSQQR